VGYAGSSPTPLKLGVGAPIYQYTKETMNIKFKERPICQAPLTVLRHLYYYTTQYGLSVKQFTGEHWKYWEEIPNRLRNVQHDPEGLQAVITELDRLAAGSETRLQKRRAQINKGKWEEKEVVLNAQLVSVLAALPASLLALGFKALTNDALLPQSLSIVDLLIEGDKGEDKDFVEPDILLLGQDHLLMVESKTRGGEGSSRNYPPGQLLNYLQLVAKCRSLRNQQLPNKFTHLILVPSEDSKWLEQQSDWVKQTYDETGRMRVDPNACIKLSARKASYNYDQLREIASEIPIYYRSWGQLHRAFESAINIYSDHINASHWERIVGEINILALRASKHK